ncbi:unnamed protein product [Zymoseptoria tritici ST99CH_1A5]|uniref:Uncharacterized protein n=2 Tax=Zymoseptoria tritici TaxID=1047171 RepID=A0A2H1GG42_ZYMTR|nr:unnamed protein product [Zymoseptoria tritici ST99CH_1E4]SMR53725.1 unnamed protein product [Zymoseptoria tritici ST99CH_3D1]SMY24330.1 unnamed protein product [Zymoseptoria tritici ST99CH_1A5]
MLLFKLSVIFSLASTALAVHEKHCTLLGGEGPGTCYIGGHYHPCPVKAQCTADDKPCGYDSHKQLYCK